ncbi:helix-turn-helix domain-containing protein [Aurantiacibacter sediminis]|uniref:Helix-turn-helix transcriptional regulator n=1 Tax=Aurantiacibacter sediminis TaxID=2793064 RepID=A0ABS0N6B6_9SPHN|nr:helix-turn-helix transcriptional regulator [Aurantiacibacter sediminis]MBH5323359.1 helix-turn-helix transcriptional regulator [Aurantiacibacter sediminis]
MPVRVTLDRLLDARGMTGKELATRIGISETQLSHFRSGKVRGLRFATLSKMCLVLGCKPGDLLDYEENAGDMDD